MTTAKALTVLRLDPNAKYTKEEIENKCRKLLSSYHPDRHRNKTKEEQAVARAAFLKIGEAKDFIVQELAKSTKDYTNINFEKTQNKEGITKEELIKYFTENFLDNLKKCKETRDNAIKVEEEEKEEKINIEKQEKNNEITQLENNKEKIFTREERDKAINDARNKKDEAIKDADNKKTKKKAAAEDEKNKAIEDAKSKKEKADYTTKKEAEAEYKETKDAAEAEYKKDKK